MIHGTLLGRLLCDFALVVLIVTLAPGCQGEGKASQQFEQEQLGATKKPKRKPGQPEPYVGDFPSLAKVNIRNAVLEELGSGLEYPWAFEFISDRELLLTEFAGTMKIFNIQTRSMDAVEGLPSLPLSRGQIGLMDVALHPDFASNGIIYFSHAVQNESNPELHATGVSRAVLRNGGLSDVERIFLAAPYGKSLSNFGGALAFESEGFLYIATGDRSLRDHAQDGGLLTVKIIRLTDDGDTPPDNPFVDDADVDNRIFALGVRNPQGLYFDPLTGVLYETEHGPMGGDEVNIIEGGRNYGWPVITYGANYTTQRIGVGTAVAGMEQPLFYFLPCVATSPIAVYRGAMFPEWNGDLLVGPLKGARIHKLGLVNGAILSEHRILEEMKGRVRDIKISADGSIYILSQKGGRIYRLYRDLQSAELENPRERKGSDIYRMACATCHSDGSELFPQSSDKQAWGDKLAQGRETLEKHAIEGYGSMPPRGLCEGCSDTEIKAAVGFMIERLQ